MGFSLKRLFGSPGGGGRSSDTAARPLPGTGAAGAEMARAVEAVRGASWRAGVVRDLPVVDDWRALPARTVSGRPGVPRTRVDLEALVAARPPGWEHLAWAGLLASGLVGKDCRVPAGEAAQPDRVVDDYSRFARAALDRLREIAVAVEPALDSSAQLRAFGPPGVAGSYPLIAELAQRQLDLHDDAVALAEDVRRVLPPPHLGGAHQALRSLADGVCTQVGDFFASAVRALDSLPERLAAGETVNLTLSLVLDVDPAMVHRIARDIGVAAPPR